MEIDRFWLDNSLDDLARLYANWVILETELGPETEEVNDLYNDYFKLKTIIMNKILDKQID
jgi:hypothetical protein